MNWRDMLVLTLSLNFHALSEELRELYRNNRAQFWAFMVRRVLWFSFFAGVFLASHVTSLLVAGVPFVRLVLDFVLIIVSNLALMGAITQLAIVVMAGASLLDQVEGVFNIFSGMARRAAQVWHGTVVPIAGDEDLGLDKMRDAARNVRIWGCGMMAAHLLWWVIIWQAYLADRPIGIGLRTLMVLMYALLVFYTGWKDIPMGPRMRQAISLGLVGWFVLLSLQAFGLLDWVGEIEWSKWAEGKGLLLGGIALVLTGAYIRQFGRTRSLAKYVWGMGIVFFLLSPVFWSTTPPGRAGEVVTKVTHAAADRIEGALVPSASAASTAATTPPPAPARPTSGFNFEFSNCIDQEGELDLQWKHALTGDMSPALREKVKVPARGIKGFSKKFPGLEAGPGVLLRLQFTELKGHTFEVDGSVVPPRARRDPLYTNSADPMKPWKNLEYFKGFWRFKLGCADEEEP